MALRRRLTARALTVLSIAAGGAITVATPANGALTMFATRAAFNAAHPGATFEDFEEARVPAASSAVIPSPLDSSTNNAVFLPGEIVPGLRLIVPPGPAGENNLFVSGPGFANYVSHAISFNLPTTPQPQITIDLYDNNVRAYAMDLTSNPNGNSVTVGIFSGAISLGNFVVPNVQGSGTFFGLSSDSDVITRVTLSDSNFFGVDNIAFQIPEPGMIGLAGVWGLALLARRHRGG